MSGLLGAEAARFFRFALVGGTGFVVDAGLLTLLHNGAGIDPFTARLISISVSAFTTWRLNRVVTFGASDRSQASEGARYALVAALTAGLNYCLYAAGARRLAWRAADPRRHRRDACGHVLLLFRLFALRVCWRGGGARTAQFAQAIAPAAERHVQVEMRGVGGVRAWPQHRREIVAGALSDLRLEFRFRRPGFAPPIPTGLRSAKPNDFMSTALACACSLIFCCGSL